ncbi:methionyl-tRNA formyltransferase [Lutimonas saemankumensis]|uniref:methionyl-tRNA formyltransferase n=1 Tax=Lutimonas saemankumensis TaxID=483016 RepID=UPI001CD3CE09|nr:methionyl-tRNA formyltransferase [Lutimonas saemankumensis]MCA0931685.1 methionyl-tRNA formyltransferase [Lutimonas saemankumensis]
MRELRIVFMGTPDFAVNSLKALVEGSYHVVGVITAPDRPAGRGRKLNESAVKKYAISEGLNILQPTNLKDPAFLSKLKDLNADLQVVVAFRMLPKQVWAMPKYGTFNLHASLLPQYRGAAPINWAIINGEHKTGVTTFFINEEIDTGSVILQKETDISREMSAGDLHDILMDLGSNAVIETVELIKKGSLEVIPQGEGDYKSAPKLNKDNSRINWTKSGNDIYNHIRGLSPYPGAWSTLENNQKKIELKIYKTKIITEQHDLEKGVIVASKKNLKVAVENGFIEILDLKLAGKKRMDARSLLNGYIFSEGSKMI